jgi:hypothetical protein
VNYWDSRIVTDENKRLFPAGGPGYVLLNYETANNPANGDLQTVLDAGLTPIIRYSNPGYSNLNSNLPAQSWIEDLGNFIETPNDQVHLHDQVHLYIIGNEPNLERVNGDPFAPTFTPERYATAYARLWSDIHVTRNIPVTQARLLVAGPATHGLETTTWLRNVSDQIVNQGAEVDGYAIHAYGFGLEYNDDPTLWVRPTVNGVTIPNIAQVLRDSANNITVNCPIPWAANRSCQHIGATWPEQEHSFAVFEELIADIPDRFADRPIYITEFNTFAWGDGDTGVDELHYDHNDTVRGPISPYVPANNYPIDWIPQAVQRVNAYNTAHPTQPVEGLLWFTGANSPASTEWQTFALTEDTGRLDCARADFRSVTHNEPAGQCDPQASVPFLNANFICDAGNQPNIGIDFSGLGFALDKLFITASPTSAYNISGYDPESHHTLVLSKEKMPPVGGYATIMVSNRAGLITQQRVYNPGCTSNSSTPGGDHPDDNESAASSILPGGQFFTLPAGARAIPRVAVLNRGFAGNLWQALLQLGEPADFVKPDFDPAATARQYPVLFIPSGGLYGWENSVLFRKRLELYAEAGGTIVAFAQQHGYEFGVLPGAQAA